MIQELARSCPYPINRNGTFESQVWMMLNQILAEQSLQNRWKVVLSDRSVYDPFVYGSYLSNNGHIDEAQIDFLREIMDAWIKLSSYNAVFLFEPLPIKGDIDRPEDSQFQADIDRMFNLLFEQQFLLNAETKVIRVTQSDKFSRREFVLDKVLELIKQ